jgi:hypothetical protein
VYRVSHKDPSKKEAGTLEMLLALKMEKGHESRHAGGLQTLEKAKK